MSGISQLRRYNKNDSMKCLCSNWGEETHNFVSNSFLVEGTRRRTSLESLNLLKRWKSCCAIPIGNAVHFLFLVTHQRTVHPNANGL